MYDHFYEVEDLSFVLFLVKTESGLYIAISSKKRSDFFGEPILVLQDTEGVLMVYPFDFSRYLVLTQLFPHLKPVPFDKRPSFGCGDRLGMVSAGHLLALQKFPVFPVLAQQSPRELQKTHRTFWKVLLGAAWGILESGYQGPFGADADHIKDEQSLLEARNLGFSMYTLDLSDSVNYQALIMSEEELLHRYERLTVQERETFRRYRGKRFSLSPEVVVEFSEEKLLPLILAYLPAIEKVEYFFALLREKVSSFDLEISLDEGESVTSPEVHFLVAEELHRRGVDFHSLAPRFPGTFEKGIDYRGDQKEFARILQSHVVVRENLEGYRLSLHSGSDKFSVYPTFFRETGGLFHVKTSGTSWLQALAVVAERNPDLFRMMYRLAYDTFEENIKAYRISVRKEELCVDIEKTREMDLPKLLADFRVRQLLHISYGSILDVLGKELRDFLFREENVHYQKVCENIEKHLKILFEKEE